MERKWYQQTWAIIALLWLFVPVGLYLMWRHASWGGRWKWAISGILAALVVVVAVSGAVGGGDDGDDSRTVVGGTATEAPPTEQGTQKPTEPPTEIATEAPTAEPTEPPAATSLPSWEDGAPITEDTVRGALDDADELIRSEDLGRPRSVSVVTTAGSIVVRYKAENALGETDLLSIGAQTSFSAMRALFANPRVQTVRVTLLADWTDQYGQTEEKETTSSLLRRETVDIRINWDGLEDRVYADNKLFFCISEDYYIHPAIYVRLEDKGCLLQ